MASKLADIEILQCPLCRNEIDRRLLERFELDMDDLDKIQNLVKNKSLMQAIEIGTLTSKYLKPESLGTEIQVKESLNKLSEKATDLMEKARDLADEFVKTSEEKKLEITKEHLDTQKEMIDNFQNEIKKLQEDYNKLEERRNAEIEKLNLAITQVHEKIVGTGIGGVRELTVIKDLKAACPEDEFSDEEAQKHGADIVAMVKIKGHDIGRIVISVKDVEKWNSSFITQIKRNMDEQQTQWSMLVTKTFPSSALNDNAYLDSNNILLVKAEYAPAAYIGLRHAVIQWSQAQTLMKTQEAKTTMQEHILKVLREWIQGTKFSEILSKIDEAMNASKDTDDLIQKWQNYNEIQAKNARVLQNKIRTTLFQCNDILADLQNRLHEKTEISVKVSTKCPSCGKVANSHQDIDQLFGFRNMDGKILPQSWCRDCRKIKNMT
jgi:gas vesicle protein